MKVVKNSIDSLPRLLRPTDFDWFVRARSKGSLKQGRAESDCAGDVSGWLLATKIWLHALCSCRYFAVSVLRCVILGTLLLSLVVLLLCSDGGPAHKTKPGKQAATRSNDSIEESRNPGDSASSIFVSNSNHCVENGVSWPVGPIMTS